MKSIMPPEDRDTDKQLERIQLNLFSLVKDLNIKESSDDLSAFVTQGEQIQTMHLNQKPPSYLLT